MSIPPLFLFDVDGTLARAGEPVREDIMTELQSFQTPITLGIVGGGTFSRISAQLGAHLKRFEYVFSECGCVFHQRLSTFNDDFVEVFRRDIRHHPRYGVIQELIKTAMRCIADMPHTLTGHLVDIRTGLVYISPLGMDATAEERTQYLESRTPSSRRELITAMVARRDTLLGPTGSSEIDVVEGGSIGVAVLPVEHDKAQVATLLLPGVDQLTHFFGDKAGPAGNDRRLLQAPGIIGHPVRSPDDTLAQIRQLKAELSASASSSASSNPFSFSQRHPYFSVGFADDNYCVM